MRAIVLLPSTTAMVCAVLALSVPIAAQDHAAPSDERDTRTESPEGRSEDTGSRASFTVTIPGTEVTLDMLSVPAGTHPASGIEIGPFWVARTETTWDAYDAFVYRLDAPEGVTDEALDAVARPSNPYILADYGFGHEGYPVISVSDQGAAAFCEWLSAHTGRRFRLPTEEEWEFVCCAGGGCDDEAEAEAQVWTAENAAKSTHPVAAGAPDRSGLHDMRGNVTEWCTAADGTAVAKGGCYLDKAEAVDCTTRRTPTPEWNARDPQIPKSAWWLSDAPFSGFRVVCEDGPPAAR